jgi:tetratricopeptide (TPR) repeat protein
VKRWCAPWLVALAAGAAVLSVIDTVGWLRWRSIALTLPVNPDLAATRLASEPLVALPSVVVRTTRLAVGDLVRARQETLVAALARVGGLQCRWLPAEAVGYTNIAREALVRNDPQRSIESTARALARDPTSAFLRRLQALFFFSVGNRTSALAELAVAEAISPGMREPEVELIPEDQRTVRLEGLRLRAGFYPRRSTETALDLAAELRSDGDTLAAEQLLAAFRGRPNVELELARWAVDAGDYNGALELLMPIANRPALPRSIRARAWAMVAVTRDLDGDGKGALAAAGEALAIDPDSPAPYVTLAGLAQNRGDLETALAHLRRAWGMDPTNTGLLLRIAIVAEQGGKAADALLALERAVEVDPDSPHLSARLVELELRSGHYPQAAVDLSQALDRHPTDPDLLRLAERLQREVGIR